MDLQSQNHRYSRICFWNLRKGNESDYRLYQACCHFRCCLKLIPLDILDADSLVWYQPRYIQDAQGRTKEVERPDLHEHDDCILCDLEREKRIQEVLAVCAKEL